MRDTDNEFILRVWTNLEMLAPQVAERILTAWSSESSFRPELFATGEPVRRDLAREGIGAALSLWTTRMIPLMLRRKSNPRFTASLALGQCSVWMPRNTEDDAVVSLFRFIIPLFEATFGCATTWDSFCAKHQVRFEDRLGVNEMLVGLQNPQEMIPGIYWITYFGCDLVSAVGPALRTAPSYKAEDVSGGVLVTAYRASSSIGSAEALEKEKAIARHLGASTVFDVATVDASSLGLSRKTAEMIEAEIRARRDPGSFQAN